jgi:hypothetical protein
MDPDVEKEAGHVGEEPGAKAATDDGANLTVKSQAGGGMS